MVLSYLHHFHAGSIHDVFKHTLLSLLLRTPVLHNRHTTHKLCYIDTHSSTAIHKLNNREQQYGIDKLLQSKHVNITLYPYLQQLYQVNNPSYIHSKQYTTEIQQYIKLFNQQLNTQQSIDIPIKPLKPTMYPGSTYILQNHIKSLDILHSCELHNNEFDTLKHNIHTYCNNKQQIQLHKTNGYEFLEKFRYIVKQAFNQYIVFIDPTYESKSHDYESIIHAITQFYTQYNNTVFIIWSPIYPSDNYPFMQQLQRTKLPQILNISLQYTTIPESLDITVSKQKRSHIGLSGSHMTICNTPYMYDKLAKYAMNSLTSVLSDSDNPLTSDIQWIKQ